MIGFPNNIDLATLSGGVWSVGLPQNNIKKRALKEYARTTDVALASAVIDIDQGKLRNTRVLAVVNHNFSQFAKYRIRSSIDAFASFDYDSGWQDVWPVVYPFGTKGWEDPNWFGGKLSEEEMQGYTANLIHLLPTVSLHRYWRIEIDDTTNPAGYLQCGRVFIGPAWQPEVNMTWGASIAWETKTEVAESEGGSESFKVRTPYRVSRYKLEHIAQDVAMATVFEMQRRAGIDKELLWIENPDDAVNALRTRYLGRMRQLSPIEYPYYEHHSTAFEIKELQ